MGWWQAHERGCARGRRCSPGRGFGRVRSSRGKRCLGRKKQKKFKDPKKKKNTSKPKFKTFNSEFQSFFSYFFRPRFVRWDPRCIPWKRWAAGHPTADPRHQLGRRQRPVVSFKPSIGKKVMFMEPMFETTGWYVLYIAYTYTQMYIFRYII